MVRVKVPATSGNLGSGFDAIGMAFNLYNYITMEVVDSGLEISIKGEGEKEIPRNHQNIIWQAAVKVFEKVSYRPRGMRLILENHIPIASGLGSSATSIVGGMFAANILSGEKLTREEILTLAVEMEGHTDNAAPALFGGVVVAAKSGEKIYFSKIVPPEGLSAVAAVPDYQLATKKARSVLPDKVPLADAVFNLGRASLLTAAFLKGDLELLEIGMEDRLHQPYRSSLIPGMEGVFQTAKTAGALSAAISGAGPTLIAFCRTANQNEIAQAVERSFREQGTGCRIFKLSPEPEGVRVSFETES